MPESTRTAAAPRTDPGECQTEGLTPRSPGHTALAACPHRRVRRALCGASRTHQWALVAREPLSNWHVQNELDKRWFRCGFPAQPAVCLSGGLSPEINRPAGTVGHAAITTESSPGPAPPQVPCPRKHTFVPFNLHKNSRGAAVSPPLSPPRCMDVGAVQGFHTWDSEKQHCQ